MTAMPPARNDSLTEKPDLPSQRFQTLNSWRQEFSRLSLIGLLGACLGWLFGAPTLGFCTVLLLSIAVHLRRLAELRAWLKHPKRYELPEPGGIWGEVFDRLLDMQRRSRKKKKRLSAMLSEFQASTAALPDGAVVLGSYGEISWFNTAAQKLLGLSQQDVGLRIPNLIRSPLFADYFAAGIYEHEVEAPSPINRNKTLSLRIIPYGNAQRLLITRDISELKRLETARRDFVANASHELRTPLTVLRGYLEMLEPEAQERGPLAEWKLPLMEMKNQAQRMESLVQDMLKLARLEADTQNRQDLLDVPFMLKRVIEESKALSQGNHQFESHIEENLLLRGGEIEVMSIFTNLLSNAVRYTPAGGLIRVQWAAELDGACFSVTDSGIGISARDLPRLTERFYRVDEGRSRASGGTGLGLSIVKHAVERHDGRLHIASEMGVGSTFSCHFPMARVKKINTA
jgi:two-component system phosphate regulon sensor histidine kinase PhoR